MNSFLFVVLLTPNIARNGTATQSSDYHHHSDHSDPDDANFAIDRNFNTNVHSPERCAHTQRDSGAWWQVDLLQIYEIHKVSIITREGGHGKILFNSKYWLDILM